ncbi:MAG: hypothetical protein II584_02700 [Treponema sp.]|nr:hypothetical protein [Treponema sp.]
MKTVSCITRDKKYHFTSSVRLFLPRHALVPLNRDGEDNFTCIVNQGDTVEEGQIVGFYMDEGTGSKVYVHSSIPGKVESFEKCLFPDGKSGTAAKVSVGGSFSFLGKKLQGNEWQWDSPEKILETISEKGVCNTFGKKCDLALQIQNCTVNRGRFLVVRMFDDDPSYETDSFVAENCTGEIMQGVHIVSKALKAKGIVFVLPRKREIAISDDEFGTMPVFKLCMDDERYPTGLVQNIVHAVKAAPKTQEQAVFDEISQFGLFLDPETLYSVYEAVVLGKPVVESFVHATGNCLRSSALFKVRIGTTVRSLMDQCGGCDRPLGKIIVNGAVLGDCVKSLDTIITKEVKSVSFIPSRELSDQERNPCVRCGKCRGICPEGIFPDLIYRHCNGGKKIGQEMIETSMLCSGCSLCNSVCPSRLPLCQTIENLRNVKQ